MPPPATPGTVGGPAEIVAPMPGAVLTVHVAAGASVAAGDPIVTLEAMKMEHVVAAPIGGTVIDVHVRPATRSCAATPRRPSSPDGPASGTLRIVRTGGSHDPSR